MVLIIFFFFFCLFFFFFFFATQTLYFKTFLVSTFVIFFQFNNNNLQWDNSMLSYNNYLGVYELRQALAEFLTEQAKAPEPLNADQVSQKFVWIVYVQQANTGLLI